jgi:hypothetical protein
VIADALAADSRASPAKRKSEFTCRPIATLQRGLANLALVEVGVVCGSDQVRANESTEL